MELYNKAVSESSDRQMYNALSSGDLPAAWLLSKNICEENPASVFNRGLCLFMLEEWEKALAELKRAEQLLGNPPEPDISEKELFLRAIEQSGSERLYLPPLDPDAVKVCGRYGLIRVKLLSAMCLEKLGRGGEALTIKRFLSQYNINL